MLFYESDIPIDLMEFFESVEDGTAKNVWVLGPQPFPKSHYAVFPTEIPRRAIKAGSSEKGQCPACGAPWRRVVERSHPNAAIRIEVGDKPRNIGQQQERAGRTFEAGHGSRKPLLVSTTTGWRSGCQCDAGEPIPCVVLDPFVGSGRSMLVAQELGRSSIGIDLNPTSIEFVQGMVPTATVEHVGVIRSETQKEVA